MHNHHTSSIISRWKWRLLIKGLSIILLGMRLAFAQDTTGVKMDELERVKQIQARHEKELMKLPGVLGVGIGSEAGRLVIAVFVDKTVRKKPKLPTQLEGVPVKVTLTGKIKALSETKMPDHDQKMPSPSLGCNSASSGKSPR
jgi:hypothetical protein